MAAKKAPRTESGRCIRLPAGMEMQASSVEPVAIKVGELPISGRTTR